MAKKRSCRRTTDENVIHEKAVKMRRMTDEQLVHYVEDRAEKARSEGFRQFSISIWKCGLTPDARMEVRNEKKEKKRFPELGGGVTAYAEST